MRWVISLSILLLCQGSAADPLPDVIDRIRPAVVGVGTAYPVRQPTGGEKPNRLLGTGFAPAGLDLTPNAVGLQIVTNHHVVPEKLDWENRQTLAVFTGRGKDTTVRPAKVIATDEIHDLALLRIEGEPLPTVNLGDADGIREGERVAFTGFPIGAVLGLYPVTHRGIVSVITPVARPADTSRELTAVQLLRMRNPFDVFQLDAVAYPGNSGSPVYRPETGEVIGVLNSVFIKESREALLERPSGISYAIPVRHLQVLLRQLGE